MLRRVESSEQTELAAAMRPYLSELAQREQASGKVINGHYPFLPLYWTETAREAYWILDQGERVGFALINRHTYVRNGAWSIAEFFVAAARRREGLGRRAAAALFALHPGFWEIGIQPGNEAALTFWTKVLEECAAGRFDKYDPGKLGNWLGSLFVAEV